MGCPHTRRHFQGTVQQNETCMWSTSVSSWRIGALTYMQARGQQSQPPPNMPRITPVCNPAIAALNTHRKQCASHVQQATLHPRTFQEDGSLMEWTRKIPAHMHGSVRQTLAEPSQQAAVWSVEQVKRAARREAAHIALQLWLDGGQIQSTPIRPEHCGQATCPCALCVNGRSVLNGEKDVRPACRGPAALIESSC